VSAGKGEGRGASFTVEDECFNSVEVVVGSNAYIVQSSSQITLTTAGAGKLAAGLMARLTPSVETLTNGQQYAQDYTPGADKAREIVSWLESGETRNRVYRLVRDALNEPIPSKTSEIERAWLSLADRPCETEGLEDMEAGCCAPCRCRAALAQVPSL
jgi:hypothetical protein